MIKRNASSQKIDLAARFTVSPDKPGSRRWREEAKALYEYMHRNFRDSLELRARLYPKNHVRHLPRYIPFVERVVREKTPVRLDRDFLDRNGRPLGDEAVELIRSFYAETGLNEALSSARKQLVALGQSTVWLWPTPGMTSVKAFTIPVHKQSVDLAHAMASDEGSVERWYLEIPVASLSGFDAAVETAVACITPHRQFWAEALDDETGKPLWGLEDVNALGRIPVAMMRSSEPEPGYFWCEVPGDLLHAQRALNMDLTSTAVIADMQGFSQAVAKGLTSAQTETLEVGPETVIGLPDIASDFTFASPNADLRARVETTTQYMQAVISAQGLSPQTFLKSSGITAMAKRIENQSRDAERRWDMPTIQRAEQRCYDLLRGWLRALRGVDVLPDAVVEVQARDVVDIVDPLHDAQALQLAIYGGQTDAVAARAEREGCSREEAARRVRRSFEVTGELQRLREELGLPATPVAGTSSQMTGDDREDVSTGQPGRPRREPGDLADEALS